MFHLGHIFTRRQYVRPWALAAPVIVLIIATPLLRPLRHPTELSIQESARLAAMQALVEHRQFVAANLPPDQPVMPVFTLLLAGPYWLLAHTGYRLSKDTAMVSYLLTLLSATIPVAAAPGLIYRMGRIFVLSRPLRASLALGVTLCSGLISYATVINPHAAAAFLVLAAASSLIRSGAVPRRSGAAVAFAGFFVALAAAIDLSAVPFLLLFPLCVLAVRAPFFWRVGALFFFILGAFPPLLLHTILTTDIINAHPPANIVVVARTTQPAVDPDDEDIRPSALATAAHGTGRFGQTLFGSHGLLSHYPVMILGLAGIYSVLRRYWPRVVKLLAILSAAGALVVLIAVAMTGPDDPELMYAAKWFIPFSPLLLFWSGAWLRQRHRPWVWAMSAVLIAFSAGVGIVGAFNPYPPGGYPYYTPLAAIHHWVAK
ncbi:MAG TPA: hypothetical protein VGG19_03700 [Tepidisphaeraceae bacterium]